MLNGTENVLRHYPMQSFPHFRCCYTIFMTFNIRVSSLLMTLQPHLKIDLVFITNYSLDPCIKK